MDIRLADVARLNQMISNSRILVIASHDVEIVRKFCNMAALMETGRIVEMGPVEPVVALYTFESVAA